MSKKKEKNKKGFQGGSEERGKECRVKQCKKKKGNSFINLILFAILIVGLGWLGYSNGYFSKSKNQTRDLKNKIQVQNFIDKNGEMLFSGAKFEVKSIEKEDGIWRSILEIDGQLQDFYTTTDGQIILGIETVSKILQSDKEEVLGDVDKLGIVKVNDDLKQKIQEFIKANLIQGDIEIEVTEVGQEYGLVKAVAISQGQEQILYLTTNGKKLVFGLISIEEYKKRVEDQAKVQEKVSSVSAENKNDKPVVEYFVMSYCPYGTQFEKGIIPAVRMLGDKIDAKMKFVSYVMHDRAELNENLAQYCIQKEQGDKFYDYLDCFLASKGKEGDIRSCIVSTGVNQSKLASCVDGTDKEFKITENYKDKSTWKGKYPSFNTDKTDNEKYSVGGSPTLVINGEKISTARDSKTLLKAICSGFKNPPIECEKELSSDIPAPGFGSGKASGSTSSGGCKQ